MVKGSRKLGTGRAKPAARVTNGGVVRAVPFSWTPTQALALRVPAVPRLGLLAAWFGCGNEINYRLFFFFFLKPKW